MSPGTFVFLLICAARYSDVFSASYKCPGVAEYSLSFYGMWSNANHMGAFPTGGQFSPLIGCSHEDAYTMWATGMKASPGVKTVAETGNATSLYRETAIAIMDNKIAWKAFMAFSLTTGTGHLMPPLNVKVTRDFSLVSLVTMLAPSPDWFTGIMKMDLCNGTAGTWLDSMTVDMLHPWDAGTDEGTMFDTSDVATNPPGYITRITKSSDTPFKNVQQASIATLGKLKFERINKPTMPMQCSGEETYSVTFQGRWTLQSHPNGFPSGAHFSPIVGATHSYKYQFWGDMIRASPGVKKVAEIGVADTLNNEINGFKKPGFVFESYKASSASGAASNITMVIKVKAMYSWVSLITMIAPSPDWFVGVDRYNLCASNGQWTDSATVDLFPWDAGTEQGFNFASTDIFTMPPDVITRITPSSDTVMKGDAANPLARIIFQRQPVFEPASISTPLPGFISTSSPFSSASSIIGLQGPSTENGGNEKSEGNSAQRSCCGVGLVFLIVVVQQALLIVRG